MTWAQSYTIGGKRGGKTLQYRRATEAAALAGEHVHALARDGMWCVTAQPVGFLWALLVPPGTVRHAATRGRTLSRFVLP